MFPFFLCLFICMKLTEGFRNRLKQLSGILEESTGDQIYFETLSQLMDYVKEKVSERGYEIESVDNKFFHFGTGGIEYGNSKKEYFELTKDGLPTNKKLVLNVYRMDSGRYELNYYIA